MLTRLEALAYRVRRYVYPPGAYFPEHANEADKIDGVLSGQFRLSIRGESLVLTAGDRLAVPRGVVHSAQVVGNEPVVSLDAIKL